MDFALSDEQQMLQDMLARLIREHYGFEQRDRVQRRAPGFSETFRTQLAELGVLAMPIDEAHGGMGGGGVENLVVMQELGRGLCLEPFLESQILGGGLVQALGSEAQREALLPVLAAGELLLAVASEEPRTHYRPEWSETRAERIGDGWQLSGRKSVVFGGQAADEILVVARTAGEPGERNGLSLFRVDPAAEGVQRRAYPTMAGPWACDLVLVGVTLADDALLGCAGAAFEALDHQLGRAMAAQCAEAVGSMQQACELTLEYLKTRRQFGQPIGRFQVLQHRMVDMTTELELATSMAILAACVADEPASAERSRQLVAAQHVVKRAAQFIAEQAVQLHGGIGMTWEYSLAHHARHLVMLGHRFGDDDRHLRVYADLLEAN
ncbi:pimeloyl-CoA dehydrogenase small subunit [Billgrantia sulfidoxydans]|uniref:Pimeloyl-CoA dehydrogenase small subunit n=1 Tax=Billgrantia sulfidoxydans TaxID=2733484 RepID=A0ABX7W881_9GAMM|nr:acyl-CoA dehydrogenase [Halomonas sulfidoxydans]QTP56559.1 pimeloyl-CoA dehydrogenase small subunit [Halomonas sulfidoxydans]